MFGIFNKNSETLVSEIVIDKVSTNVDCPQRFYIYSSKTDIPQVYQTYVEYERYLQGLATVQTLVNNWVNNERTNLSGTIESFLDKFEMTNILSIQNYLDRLDESLNTNSVLILNRIYELLTIIELSVDPEVLSCIRGRYVWQLCKMHLLDEEEFPLDNIYECMLRHGWVWLIPIYRINKLTS